MTKVPWRVVVYCVVWLWWHSSAWVPGAPSKGCSRTWQQGHYLVRNDATGVVDAWLRGWLVRWLAVRQALAIWGCCCHCWLLGSVEMPSARLRASYTPPKYHWVTQWYCQERFLTEAFTGHIGGGAGGGRNSTPRAPSTAVSWSRRKLLHKGRLLLSLAHPHQHTKTTANIKPQLWLDLDDFWDTVRW